MRKIDIKSLLIGFLSCVVLILIVGFKSIEPSSAEVGRYQISTTTMGNYQTAGYYIFETIIDTKTGNITARKKTNGRIYY